MPPPDGIAAEAWLVADATSGAILAAHNPDLPDLPASTMKMLTALTVLPGLSPDREVTISDEAAQVDGTRVGLVPGVRYTVRDLATAMLIASGNDATVALVEAAGGRQAVLGRMNRLAADLGARDTVAGDPTGLDADGQRTTAHDLAVIGRAVLNEPIVRGYLTVPRASLPGRGDERFEIANHNTLLGTYDGTIGIKNGYTVAAGATFVGAATRGGRTLIVSLLRTAPAYAVDAKALLDWGFAHAADIRPVGRLAGPSRAEAVADASPGGAGGDLPGTGGAGGAGAADGADADRADDAPSARLRPAGPEDEAGGVGPVTWLALTVTLVASALTLRASTGRRSRTARRSPRHSARPRGGPGRGRPSRVSPVSRAPARPRVHRPPPDYGDADLSDREPHDHTPSGRAWAPESARPTRPGARPRTRAGGGRHLVGLPSLMPDQPRDDTEGHRRAEHRRTETPPFGTARSPGP